MTQEQARQEAERRVREFYTWGIRKEGQTLSMKECKELDIISINRDIELLDELKPYISSYGLKYYQRELDDLNQIKEELLKM